MKRYGYKFGIAILFSTVICLICTGFSSWSLSSGAKGIASNVSVRFSDILHQSQSNVFSNIKIESDPLRFDASAEDNFGNVIFEDRSGSDGEQLDLSLSGTLTAYSSVLSVRADLSIQTESDQSSYDRLIEKGYIESPVFPELDRESTESSLENYGSYWSDEKDSTGEIRPFRMKSHFSWGSFFCNLNPAKFFDSGKSNGEKRGTDYSVEEKKRILTEIYALNQMHFTVTLTAVPISYEVSFIIDGVASETITGMSIHDSFTIPQENPSKEGATFLGWSLNQNSSEGEYFAGTAMKVADVVRDEQTKIYFYAIWNGVDIKVTFVDGNEKTYDPGPYKYGDTVTFPDVDTTGFSKSGYSFVSWKCGDVTYSANSSAELTEAKFPGILETKSVTFVAQWKSDGCFVKGTEVLLADGTVEKVENLERSDRILSFNHESGAYESSSIAAIINHGRDYYDVMYMHFSDGTQLGFIEDHGMFDIEEMRYVPITCDTIRDYVGHRFIRCGGSRDKLETVTMIGYDIVTEYTESYTIVSSVNLNHVLNGMLAMTTVITGVYDYFAYDEDLRWNETAMNRDIETYGLYTYDDWKKYTSFKIFIDFNFRYFRVSIGKGLMTEATVIGYIAWLENCYSDGTAKQ